MSLVIVSLEYLEPDWQITKKCIEQCSVPVIYVSRDGVGNMARAFNNVNQQDLTSFDFAWFITNIRFAANAPEKLERAMTETGFAGIHPAMHGSDHQHQHPDGSGAVKPVHFVEWTAPVVRTDVFKNFPLEEGSPYWYFDLDWSYRVKQAGMQVGVHHGVEVNHTYLRNMQPHPITKLRRELRDWWKDPSVERMTAKYGPDWKNILSWHG